MIIQTPDRTFESSGLIEQGNFAIKTSPAAFLLLSSGLYTNKVKAVLREIGCNAVDAHTLNANEKTPIEVKLPNNLDRQFYIKDFGPGLSHEQVMKLYTTYFESSKQDSDDFIGGFGVGSKSPFAYTDTFTVESRYNGVKRLYTAYVGGNGVPAIAKMLEEETTEVNGLTVGFPVKDSDVKAFERECANVFSWFNPRPRVLGAILDWTEADAKEDLGDVTIFENGNVPGYGSAPVLKMGSVAYPMGDFWEQYSQTFGKETDPAVSALRNFPIAINVPIGTSNVAASREALQFDKLSLERTHAALIPIAQQLARGIGTRLSQPKRFFDRLDLAKNWFDKVGWNPRNVRALMTTVVGDNSLDNVIDTAYSRNATVDPLDYPNVRFVSIDYDVRNALRKITERKSFGGIDKYSGLQSLKRKTNLLLGPNKPSRAVPGGSDRMPVWGVAKKPFKWSLSKSAAYVYGKALPDLEDPSTGMRDAWPFMYHMIRNGELTSDTNLWFTPAPGVTQDQFMDDMAKLSDQLGLVPQSFLTPPEPPKEATTRPDKVLMGLSSNNLSQTTLKKVNRSNLQRSGEGTELPADEPILCILYDRKAQHSYLPDNLIRVVEKNRALNNTFLWNQFAAIVGLPDRDHVYYVPQEDWEDVQDINPDAISWEDVKTELLADPITYAQVLQATEKPAGSDLNYDLQGWLRQWRHISKSDSCAELEGTVFDEILKKWDIEVSASDEYQRAMNLRRAVNELVGWTLPLGEQLDRSEGHRTLMARYPLLHFALDRAKMPDIVQYIKERESILAAEQSLDSASPAP